MWEKNHDNYCKICDNAKMQKTINAKNARNFAIQEILFIMINCIAINVINARSFSHLSQFLAFIVLCEKYSHYAKNAICEKLKIKKWEKFCNTRNPIYHD